MISFLLKVFTFTSINSLCIFIFDWKGAFLRQTKMKRTNKLSKVKKKFCKLTEGLAHKDCPDNCPKKITKEISKDRIRILERYESQINLKKEQRDNLYFFWVMDEGFKSEPLKYKDIKYFEIGEYDEKKAMKECAFIRMKFADELDNPDPEGEGDIMKLRDCLRQMRKRKEEGRFVKRINPKPISEIEAYPFGKEFFGSDIKFKRLKDEIEDLIAKDVNKNNKTLRELRKNYHLYKKDENKDFDIVGTLWDWIKKDKKFIKQERKVNRLFKKQQPLKGRRTIKRPKPFDEFSISLVLAAKEKEIITGEEARILKYRYNLEGNGIRSLRLIAGWLGISHTNVRNIEIKALKKMKEHIREIKKSIPIKEPIGRDITEEEYKRRYGHYPDLGKK